METEVVEVDLSSQEGLELAIIRARRTAFVARFIVLRESKRTRAHRAIELMEWVNFTTVEELATRFRAAFDLLHHRLQMQEMLDERHQVCLVH